MNITILGTGAFGIALYKMFSLNESNAITLWTYEERERDLLYTKRCNTNVLSGVYIDSDTMVTTSISDALRNCDILVIAIPSKFILNVCNLVKPFYNINTHILIASKGISDDYRFLYEIVGDSLNTRYVSVISGPSFARDMANGDPIGLSISSMDSNNSIIISALGNNSLSLSVCDDILGVSVCGAIKNVFAIASGILAGMGFGESCRAQFMVRAISSISNIITQLGGNGNTVLSFAGIGDLLLTCSSTNSRNYSFGFLIGSNANIIDINNYRLGNTVEGYDALIVFKEMLLKRGIIDPYIDVIYDIVCNGKEIDCLIDLISN